MVKKRKTAKKRRNKEFIDLQDRMVLLEGRIENIKKHGIDDNHVLRRLSETEYMLDDLAVRVHAKVFRLESIIKDLRHFSDIQMQSAADSMDSMKDIVLQIEKDRQRLETEKEKLVGQKLGVYESPKEKAFASLKNVLNDNMKFVKDLIKADMPIKVKEIPMADTNAPSPEDRIIPEDSLEPDIKTMQNAAEVRKHDIEKANAKENKAGDKFEKYKKEYEEYIEKYGEEPSPAALIVERMFKKIDQKENKIKRKEKTVKATVEKKHKKTSDAVPLGTLFEAVDKQRNMTIPDAAKMFGVSQNEIRGWAEMLRDNGLIYIDGNNLRR